MSRRTSSRADAELSSSESTDPTESSAAPLAPSLSGAPGEGDESAASESSYNTGTGYPLVDDENQAPLDADGENPDLYGEDEQLPESEELEELSSAQAPAGATRVAALEEIEADIDDDSPEATRTGPPVKLEIVAGPDAGKAKRFKSVRMVIGRAKGCDVELSDQSVSRRHVELIHGEKGVLLRDLASGNGTRVNGEKVEERLLKHGDEISVGKTRLRLAYERPPVEEPSLSGSEDSEASSAAEAEESAQGSSAASAGLQPSDPSASSSAVSVAPSESHAPGETGDLSSSQASQSVAASGQASVSPSKAASSASRVKLTPEERKRKARQAKIRVVAVVVVAVALLLGLVVLYLRVRPEPGWEDAMKRMDQAKAAYAKGNYAEALHWVEAAELLHPRADEKEGLGKKVVAELEMGRALEDVQALVERESLEEAQKTLGAMGPGQGPNAEERQRLAKIVEAKQGEMRARQVNELIIRGEVHEARKLIAELPEEFRPQWHNRLHQAQAALVGEQLALERKKLQVAKRVREQRLTSVAEAFDGVERKFNQGEYARAVLECDRVLDSFPDDQEISARARQLKGLIPIFGRNFEDAQRKLRANALESAVKPLRRAQQAHREMGFGGTLVQTIDNQLATASLVAGQAALKREDWVSARAHFQEASRVRPDDARTQEGKQELQLKVEALYRQAFAQKAADPAAAAKLLRIVVQAADPQSKLYGEAQRQLREIAP